MTLELFPSTPAAPPPPPPPAPPRVWSAAQLAVFDAVANGAENLIVRARAGSGKCLGRGTPVLLFDGTIKPVERIAEGDVLMGPDSTPRRVLSTCAGIGPLYRVVPIKGAPWVCNDVHVLTLAGTNREAGRVRDVPLNELLVETPAGKRLDKNWKLFRVGVQFPEVPVPVDPYLVGLWMGDGSRGEPQITNCEPEVRAYCREIAATYGAELIERRDDRNNTWNLRFRVGERGEAGRHTPHFLRQFFIACGTTGEKVIPGEYLVNSERVRRELLAGIIDTDGYVAYGSCQIAFAPEGLCEQVAFLARSLGLAAYRSTKVVRVANGTNITYQMLSISGDLASIPCRVPRRQAPPRQQIKDVRRTGFTVEPLGTGEYFGFTLDGDGRFLLGDFTVTHNTTTLIEAVRRVRGRSVLLCAFNKSIASELERRAPRHVTVRTLHSLGYAALTQHWPGTRVDNKRGKRLLEAALPAVLRRQAGELVSVLSLCKARLCTDPEAIERAVELSDFSGPIAAGTQAVLAAMDAACERGDGTVDFDDMVFVPVALGLSPGRFDLVVVDETQDINAAQLTLARSALGPQGRLVAVGDDRQAIYSWRGADVGFMGRMETELAARVLPLSVTYRCPRVVVDLARELVPDLEARPDAPQGTLATCPVERASWREGDAVLSRTNAPLVKHALAAIRAGVRARIQGRDLGAGLRVWVERFSVNSTTELLKRAQAWVTQERERALEIDDQEQAEQLADRLDTLTALAEGTRTVGEILDRLENLFSDEGPGLVFSSVHRAKGLEWDRVHLLAWTFCPERSDEAENIWYVACTRTCDELVLVTGDKALASDRVAAAVRRASAARAA